MFEAPQQDPHWHHFQGGKAASAKQPSLQSQIDHIALQPRAQAVRLLWQEAHHTTEPCYSSKGLKVVGSLEGCASSQHCLQGIQCSGFNRSAEALQKATLEFRCPMLQASSRATSSDTFRPTMPSLKIPTATSVIECSTACAFKGTARWLGSPLEELTRVQTVRTLSLTDKICLQSEDSLTQAGDCNKSSLHRSRCSPAGALKCSAGR